MVVGQRVVFNRRPKESLVRALMSIALVEMAVRILVITEEADKRLPSTPKLVLWGDGSKGPSTLTVSQGPPNTQCPLLSPKGTWPWSQNCSLPTHPTVITVTLGWVGNLLDSRLFIDVEQTPSLKAPKQIVKSTIVQSPGRFGFLAAGYKVIVKEETGGELVRAIIGITNQATIELKTTLLLEDAREIKLSLVVLEVLSEKMATINYVLKGSV
tara:strand:+ start:42 stop:680 length:639 start_codon:yes stop_codon:yes gene_type:complete